MKKCLFLLLLSTLCLAEDRPRVIILDTGLDLEDSRFTPFLCKDIQGIDFSGEGIKDFNNHGTHVTGIIKQYAKNSNYCLTIIKYYKVGTENLKSVISSLKLINYLKPAFVNWSGGGEKWIDDEYYYIKNTPESQFIVAAGNDNVNLDDNCKFYPACYNLPNIIRIGSLTEKGKKAPASNYGNFIDFWEIGENILSTFPEGNDIMSGTSLSLRYKNWKTYI